MNTIDILQKAINYIEENLKAEITAEELADLSGFSLYHFYHLFGSYIGIPVLAYITKRRLMHAIYEADSGKKLINVALEYGFNTHAGFFKAFKREYGCSPKKYLKIRSAKKPVSIDLRAEGKIMLTQTQIRQLLSNWDINTKSEIGTIYVAGGAVKANNTWNIGEKYVLKTGMNISGLRTHIAITNALKAEKINTASPIKTKKGEDFVVIDDRYFVLLNRIEGKFLTPEERYRSDRVETGKKYGEAIGKLHKVFVKQEENIEVNNNNLYKTVVDWALPETKRNMEQWGCPLPDEFFKDYLDNFKDLYLKLPHNVIHRDPNPSNIIFSNREVSGFVDFEISERNVRIFDPCYCATGILSEAGKIENGYEKWPELLQGVIKGYDNICDLTEVEKQAIPYVIYSIEMIFIAWLGNKEEYKNIAMVNREMLLWIWENKDKCTFK
ncbi:helix-turn-helix domain-containing protein [Oceanirhabdus sp. W0125-5]|uniref:helix-turn-helix domain-containing protein n=1 Tax=Oceanirhabdus sp. W0125-5 TaxID=2999116 RepID=UPI0022F2E26F|nr:helix-turn-helix domain-containing protein [Oceanirhabdus sp. W0125-5]WBW96705.1 helix-turn-helix domain-containing protein [Oceanirhabdus sp. W0125-5]